MAGQKGHLELAGEWDTVGLVPGWVGNVAVDTFEEVQVDEAGSTGLALVEAAVGNGDGRPWQQERHNADIALNWCAPSQARGSG